jgi:hypothetical protein
MPVKVVIKGQKEKESKPGIPAIVPPRLKKKRDNLIIRVVKVMLMDIRMRLDPKLRKDYGDYSRFCELARGKP